MMSGRFVRFLLTGGFAALINLGSRYVLNEFMSFEAAVAVAYLAGVVIAYVLAKVFVFDKSGSAVATEFRRFVIVNLLSLAVVWCVSVGLAINVFPALGFRWHAEAVAHFIGVLSPAVVSYLAHKHYTFRAAGISTSDEFAVAPDVNAAPGQRR
jgi:putative flippase GtrA